MLSREERKKDIEAREQHKYILKLREVKRKKDKTDLVVASACARMKHTGQKECTMAILLLNCSVQPLPFHAVCRQMDRDPEDTGKYPLPEVSEVSGGILHQPLSAHDL